MTRLGITRVADITGLDRLELPVVQVCRPFSKSNAVSQGKGQDLEAATWSAIGESAESFFAERLERYCVTVASARKLGIAAELYRHYVDPAAQSAWAGWDTAWVPAQDLSANRPCLVPLELVHTAYVTPPADYDGLFLGATTGLAIAPTRCGAMLHALLEVIERDALARSQTTHGFLQRYRLDPVTIAGAELQDLLSHLSKRGVLVGLWLTPGVAGVPVVMCQLLEDCEASLAILPFPAEGSAARAGLAEAAVAAIREAAQSRLAVLAGARDDVGRKSFASAEALSWRERHRNLLREGPRPVDAAAVSDCPAARHPDDLVAKLGQAGIANVMCCDIDTADVPELEAVKVVAPGLLPLWES